jgi:hypothetical protein
MLLCPHFNLVAAGLSLLLTENSIQACEDKDVPPDECYINKILVPFFLPLLLFPQACTANSLELQLLRNFYCFQYCYYLDVYILFYLFLFHRNMLCRQTCNALLHYSTQQEQTICNGQVGLAGYCCTGVAHGRGCPFQGGNLGRS